MNLLHAEVFAWNIVIYVHFLLFIHNKIAWMVEIDGLVQERRNSIANEMELRLSYTNPSKRFVIEDKEPFISHSQNHGY